MGTVYRYSDPQAIHGKRRARILSVGRLCKKKKIPLIDSRRHLILTSGHPSPLSANRGYWFGHRHFSQCNAYLQSKGLKLVEW